MITSRMTGWAGHVVHMREKNVYSILVEKAEGKRSLGSPVHR